jgi:hypothetical protein
MNQYPDDYSGYGQSGNAMQSMGYHQGNYDGTNMVQYFCTLLLISNFS